jgi:energy-coupling factor transporter transmembrane protein EcfT
VVTMWKNSQRYLQHCLYFDFLVCVLLWLKKIGAKTFWFALVQIGGELSVVLFVNGVVTCKITNKMHAFLNPSPKFQQVYHIFRFLSRSERVKAASYTTLQEEKARKAVRTGRPSPLDC